jgi:hypothetical protein
MRNQSNTGSGALSALRSLPAFVLSAILGVGFVAVVNKTHDLFSGFEQKSVIVTWGANWPGMPTVRLKLFREGM